jgi:hypothetical protein
MCPGPLCERIAPLRPSSNPDPSAVSTLVSSARKANPACAWKGSVVRVLRPIFEPNPPLSFFDPIVHHTSKQPVSRDDTAFARSLGEARGALL